MPPTLSTIDRRIADLMPPNAQSAGSRVCGGLIAVNICASHVRSPLRALQGTPRGSHRWPDIWWTCSIYTTSSDANPAVPAQDGV